MDNTSKVSVFSRELISRLGKDLVNLTPLQIIVFVIATHYYLIGLFLQKYKPDFEFFKELYQAMTGIMAQLISEPETRLELDSFGEWSCKLSSNEFFYYIGSIYFAIHHIFKATKNQSITDIAQKFIKDKSWVKNLQGNLIIKNPATDLALDVWVQDLLKAYFKVQPLDNDLYKEWLNYNVNASSAGS